MPDEPTPAATRQTDWWIFRGDRTTSDRKLAALNALDRPPWRQFGEAQSHARATTFEATPAIVEAVNAALYLRRPILVTGDPGTGKSSLAYAIAHELGLLDRVLTWHVNSRSTLGEGEYRYDAVARLRDAGIASARAKAAVPDEDIGDYITLGPLGTAFTAPVGCPYVLLIDEIDKSDVDLPNDLLHVLEDGWFDVDELRRSAARRARAGADATGASAATEVWSWDGRRVQLEDGRVRCREFPIVVITSNGERDLPPAFHRRCLRVNVASPGPEQLAVIVERHLGTTDGAALKTLLDAYAAQRGGDGIVATDQLLNAVFLVTGARIDMARADELVKLLLRRLDA